MGNVELDPVAVFKRVAKQHDQKGVLDGRVEQLR
jgi:hypothetical protein